MRHNHLQFVAMAFFVSGFVLAGSGWSLVLTGKMQSRPEWSVCGQDMCSCLPSTTIEPYCPLCVTNDADDSDNSEESSCDDTDTAPTKTPKRVPKTDRFQAASMASQAGCASIFLSFVFGTSPSDCLPSLPSAEHLITQDHVPLDPIVDLPTPPPRA